MENVLSMPPEEPKISLKPWYRYAIREEGAVIEFGNHALKFEGSSVGTLLPAVLPLLDGSHTWAEVKALVPDSLHEDAHELFQLLTDHDVLSTTELSAAPPSDTAAFFEAIHARKKATEIQQTLQNSSVAIIGENALSREIGRQLVQSGCGGVQFCSVDALTGLPPAQAAALDLIIAAPTSQDQSNLEAVNEASLNFQRPFLPVLPFNGQFAGVGPLIIPKDTCCYKCFQLRRASHLRYAEFFPNLERAPFVMPEPRFFSMLLASMATMAAIDWLVMKEHSFFPSVLQAIQLTKEIDLTYHRVYKVPRCPKCSPVQHLSVVDPWLQAI